MKRIITMIFAIVLLMILVSCQSESPNTPDTTPQEPETTEKEEGEEGEEEKVFELNASNFENFTIIRPEKCKDEVSNSVKALKARLVEMGLTLTIKMDYVGKNESIPENHPEILVGATNRPASEKYYEKLRSDDYVIAVEENQIIIVGGSDEATAAAVEDFINNHLKDFSDKITFTLGVLATRTGSYRVNTLSLCDKDISEYEIVIPDNADNICKYAASMLSQKITNVCGIRVNVVKEKSATGKSQIRLAYNTASSNDAEYTFRKTDNGLELSATKRTLIYAVREMTEILTDTVNEDSLNINPKLNEQLTMTLPTYSLPASLEGKTPIGLCDQKNKTAVVIDLSASDPTSDEAIIWEWAPSEQNGFIGDGFKNRIDELRLRYSPILQKYIVLVTSSSGFMGIAEYPSGQKIWEVKASGYGPHSIEYLPNGLVACALSGNGNKEKNEIRIYATDSSGIPTGEYIKDSFLSAHAVYWDNEFGILWAMGSNEIIAYEISGTPEKPIMTRIEGFGCGIPSGGHDFSPMTTESGLYWISTSSVQIFNKYENRIISDYNGKTIISASAVKSICGLPDGGVIRTVATGVYASHDTDTFSVFTLNSDGTYTRKNYVFEGRAFYKARPFLLH